MIVRNYTGGICFYEDTVLMLLNDKQEWGFPKGIVNGDVKLTDVAVSNLKNDAGLDASIVAPCGKTNYEFYSVKIGKPVHNNVSWFVMKCTGDLVVPNKESGYEEGKFFTIEEALEMVTYSQDKSLLMVAYQRYKEII